MDQQPARYNRDHGTLCLVGKITNEKKTEAGGYAKISDSYVHIGYVVYLLLLLY